jgi:hypothetical protein
MQPCMGDAHAHEAVHLAGVHQLQLRCIPQLVVALALLQRLPAITKTAVWDTLRAASLRRSTGLPLTAGFGQMSADSALDPWRTATKEFAVCGQAHSFRGAQTLEATQQHMRKRPHSLYRCSRLSCRCLFSDSMAQGAAHLMLS